MKSSRLKANNMQYSTTRHLTHKRLLRFIDEKQFIAFCDTGGQIA